MSDLTLKTIIASAFLLAGTGAFLTMMRTMGRPGAPDDVGRCRKVHRVFGWLSVALLIPLVYLGVDFIAEMGDGMSTRAVFHMVLAELLIVVLLLKILIVRFFKGFVRNAPALGMALFVLTLVVFLISAGFFVLQTVAAK
jgi:hypothetical protein